MFCSNCGNQLREEARFCATCGQGVAGKTPMERVGRDMASGMRHAYEEHKDVAPLLGLIALALVQLFPHPLAFIPGIALAVIAMVRGWRWSAALLISGRLGYWLMHLTWFQVQPGRPDQLIRPVGSPVNAFGNGSYPGSQISQWMMWCSVLLILIGTIVFFIERSGKMRAPSPIRATFLGLILLLATMVEPTWGYVEKKLQEHELTAEERKRADALMAEFSTKQWVCSAEGRDGRKRKQFALNTAQFRTDEFGTIIFSHSILLDGKEAQGTFQCPWQDIRLPEEVLYSMRNAKVLVRYASPDSLMVERHEQNGGIYPFTAVSRSLLDARERERLDEHHARFQLIVDSLNAITGTYTARFVLLTFNPECIAQFQVDESDGPVNIVTYAPNLIVDGTDLRNLQADQSQWRLTVRKSIPDRGVDVDPATIPERLEIASLVRVPEPVIQAVPVEKPVVTSSPAVDTKPAAKPKPTSGTKVYPFAELDQWPLFNGGTTPLPAWLKTNLIYPEPDKAAGEVGDVQLTFTIEKDGTTSGAQVMRGGTAAMRAEALRLAGIMPKWSVGMKNDQPVRVSHSITIKFKL